MAGVNAVAGETGRNHVSALPLWASELSSSHRRDIKACLPYVFKAIDGGAGWSWHSESARMTAEIKFGERKHSLVISIIDADAGEEIELWGTALNMTGLWRQRLRECSGAAMVLVQARHVCPKCGAPVKLKRRNEGGSQFFGCSNFPRCRGLIGITEHDIERG